MGAIRSFPENEVSTSSENHKKFYFVTASLCGWQYYMQDYKAVEIGADAQFFAVIDGHNGPQVAEFCARKLPELFRESELIKMNQIQSGLENIFYQLEQQIPKSHEQLNSIRQKHSMPALNPDEQTRSGCSIVLAVLSDEQIIISNIGMCRCYAIYRKDRTKAILFSGNHITSNKEEEARIVRSGGFVYDDKVNGMYAYTRSIGDLHMKKKEEKDKEKGKGDKGAQGLLTNEPSFFCLRREDISCLLLGSSGFWEKNQRVSEAMGDLGKSEQNDKQRLQQLIGKMLASEPGQQRLGLQNMTAIYINISN